VREKRDSGEEEKRTAAAVASTTARLNANSFIDWNSKSPSFDSCNYLLHPFRFSPLLFNPPFPAICIPVRASRFSHRSPPSLAFRPLSSFVSPCSIVLLLSRVYPYARLLHKRGRICIRGRACSLAGGYARHRASPPPPPSPLSLPSSSSLIFCPVTYLV